MAKSMFNYIYGNYLAYPENKAHIISFLVVGIELKLLSENEITRLSEIFATDLEDELLNVLTDKLPDPSVIKMNKWSSHNMSRITERALASQNMELLSWMIKYESSECSVYVTVLMKAINLPDLELLKFIAAIGEGNKHDEATARAFMPFYIEVTDKEYRDRMLEMMKYFNDPNEILSDMMRMYQYGPSIVDLIYDYYKEPSEKPLTIYSTFRRFSERSDLCLQFLSYGINLDFACSHCSLRVANIKPEGSSIYELRERLKIFLKEVDHVCV